MEFRSTTVTAEKPAKAKSVEASLPRAGVKVTSRVFDASPASSPDGPMGVKRGWPA